MESLSNVRYAHSACGSWGMGKCVCVLTPHTHVLSPTRLQSERSERYTDSMIRSSASGSSVKSLPCSSSRVFVLSRYGLPRIWHRIGSMS